MKIYCHQCGTAITYANAEAQPNFCHKCGANISVASETIEQDEPHNDVKFNSTLNELQVEIEKDTPRSVKLGEAMGTLNSDDQSVDDDFKFPELTNEQVLEQMQNEASTLRKKE